MNDRRFFTTSKLMMRAPLGLIVALSLALGGCTTTGTTSSPGGAAATATPELVTQSDDVDVIMGALEKTSERLDAHGERLRRIEAQLDD